ncbi:MAG: hypothetical protein ACOZNI_07400 [Myxococcota bacterium]
MQDARQALLGYLEAGQTGCIAAETPQGRRLVYVMLGEILAAQSDEDDRRILEILRNGNSVDKGKLEALQRALQEGGGLSEQLFEAVADDRVMELYFERFRDNLFQFLASDSVEFTPMEAVFTDNIQVGHDSRALIDELAGLRERSLALLANENARVAPSGMAANNAAEAQIAEMCEGGLPLRELLQRAPWEMSRALAHLAEMVETGALRILPAEIPPVAEDEEPEEDATEEASRSKLAAFQPPADYEEPVDHELAAFQDYDTSRMGGDFSGEILDRVEVSEEAPRPEPLPPPSGETIIEMEDAEQALKDGTVQAVSLNFSGPQLQDDDALRRIEVVNDVLGHVAEYLGRVEGPGAGQAQVQLLVEGTPGNLAPLFKGVEVSPQGQLPAQHVLKNLRKRPATERRRLLDRALTDLIDRALSLANEELSEEQLEELLEHVAGYQSKLR